HRGAPRICVRLLKSSLSYGARWFATSLLCTLADKGIFFLLMTVGGARESGFLSLALGLSAALDVLPLAVAQTTMPYVTIMSVVRRWWLTKWLSIATGTFLTVIAIASLFAIRRLVNALQGPAFLPAAPACVVLAFGMAAEGFARPFYTF